MRENGKEKIFEERMTKCSRSDNRQQSIGSRNCSGPKQYEIFKKRIK